MTRALLYAVCRTGVGTQTRTAAADSTDMGIAAELRDKANRGLSGHLDLVGARMSGQVWLSEGRVCTVSLSSATPALGMRLVSGGKLSLNSLGAALATQQQNPHMRLGDVLVRMGLVARHDVETVAWEQMSDAIATLMGLSDIACSFSQVPSTACPPAGPTVEELLTAAQSRASQWQEVVRQLGGPDTVPSLTDALLQTHDMTLRPEEWAVLCRIDGRRALTSIASQAGFTILEAASILQGLRAAGLVSVPVAAPAPSAPVTQQIPAQSTWGPVVDMFDDPSDLLRELSELGGSNLGGRRRNG